MLPLLNILESLWKEVRWFWKGTVGDWLIFDGMTPLMTKQIYLLDK